MSSKYEFIDGEKDNCPIVKMCLWSNVSKSGSYEWRNRPESATTQRRGQLGDLIILMFEDSDGTYGYRRIWHELGRQGVSCGPELVRAIVRAAGLVACQPRPWRQTTVPDDTAPSTPDLVKRDFSAHAPGRELVGDITCIATWEGFVYLATVHRLPHEDGGRLRAR